MTQVVNRVWVFALLLHRMAASCQLDDQRILIEFLVQSRLEFVQHRHGRANNVPGDLFMFHGLILTGNFVDFTDKSFFPSVPSRNPWLKILALNCAILTDSTTEGERRAFREN